MGDSLISLIGIQVEPAQLRSRLGRELIHAVRQDTTGLADLVQTRRIEEGDRAADIVVLNVYPEVPSHPAHPIEGKEPLGFYFPDDPHKVPEVVALRSDFPAVPHLMRAGPDTFGGLCLFDRPYEEYRARLSGWALLLRTLEWLRLTARGALHPDDQPLEPLMRRSRHVLILPKMHGSQDFTTLRLTARRQDGNANDLVVFPVHGDTPSTPIALLQHKVKPMTHGFIRQEPRTLGDLFELLESEAGTDLLTVLSGQLRERYGQGQTAEALGQLVVLLLVLPKTRSAGGEVTSVERVAFLLGNTTLLSLGEALDCWSGTESGVPGFTLYPRSDPAKYTSLQLQSMQVIFDTNREARAWMNGLSASERRTVAFGAGALGSHIINNMVRAGQGSWLIVDRDFLLPHNLARHTAAVGVVGAGKGHIVAEMLNATFQDANVRGRHGDALRPDAELQTELEAADLILDFAASAPVTRHLATLSAPGRRASAFLNPTGQDLVLLIEPQDRHARLDHLEHRYYQALVDQDELAGHYATVPPHLRYSGGCRDTTAQLPLDLIALHAATASRALNSALTKPEAYAGLWSVQDNGSIIHFPLQTGPYHHTQTGDWRIHFAPEAIAQARQWREEFLSCSPPVETGGTLVGSIDLDRQEIYVTGVLPPPADSKHYPTAFERGQEDLVTTFEHIESRTAGALAYLGEWHTHPRGVNAVPSRDDQRLLHWLCDLLRADGQPGLMLIVGETEERWIVLDPREELPHGPE